MFRFFFFLFFIFTSDQNFIRHNENIYNTGSKNQQRDIIITWIKKSEMLVVQY